MADVGPSLVPSVATFHSPHSREEPQSVEQHDLLYKAVYPAETGTQPVAVVCQETRLNESRRAKEFTVTNIINALHEAEFADADWEVLGLQLNGVSDLVLQNIRAKDLTDELKLTDLIRVWKRNDTNATWEALAEALRICHGTVTADKLREAVTESTSQSVKQNESPVPGRVGPREETGTQPGAPVSAHLIDLSHSLNSSPPCAAARVTACTPGTFKIEVKIEPPPLEDCKGDITSYRLQYREQGDNGIWKTCNIPTTTNQPTTYTIEDLQPAMKYDIQVAAKNSSGCGPFSPENKCTTDQAPKRPSAAPRFTTSSTADTIRVEIEQTPSGNPNDITAYKIEYKEERNGNWVTHDNTPSVHTIDGLRPETSYYIRVAAVNSCGAGPFCHNPKKCITKRAPTPPTDPPVFTLMPKLHNIGITIKAPPPVYTVTEYEVRYGLEADREERHFTTTKRKCKISDLQHDTSYLVSIAAVNDDGVGPFSDKRQCRTAQKGMKKRIVKVCLVAVGLLLLVLSVPALMTFIFYHGTPATGKVLYQNGTVLVGTSGFKTFFQSALNVETSAASTSGLSFFRHSCNSLPTTKYTISHVVRREQQFDTETNIPLYYEYLVDGSSVCFHANITGERNLTDCAAAIYILTDWHAYTSAFIDGNNITGNISKYCLNVSSIDQPNSPQCFMVPHPGFFFFGAYIPGKDQGLGVKLAVIQTVANKILYNTSSLEPVCKIPPRDGTRHCFMYLFDETVSTSIKREVCVLMTVEEENKDIQTLSYSAVPIGKHFRHKQNLGTVVLLPFVGVLVVLLISVLLFVIIIRIIRKRREYQLLH